MKPILLFCLLVAGFFLGAKAQDANWKPALVQTVSKKFSLTGEVAQKAVDTKETYARQLFSLQMPQVETQMGKEEYAKALLNLRQKELASMKAVMSDETKAKDVSAFLEGKIPVVPPAPRKR